MAHCVLICWREASFGVVCNVVDVHVSAGEAAAGGDVEVADDFVDADHAFKAASLAALGVDALGVVFALALFDVGAFAERPLLLSVCFPDFVAGVTATGLDGISWGCCAAALAAVFGVKVFGFVRMTGGF